MRVLGIDPGSRRTGWGVVQLEGTRLRQIAAGTIAVQEKLALAKRLRTIHAELERVIEAHAPEAVAVEEIFFAKYANAALKLGHARGVALLVAAQSDPGPIRPPAHPGRPQEGSPHPWPHGYGSPA